VNVRKLYRVVVTVSVMTAWWPVSCGPVGRVCTPVDSEPIWGRKLTVVCHIISLYWKIRFVIKGLTVIDTVGSAIEVLMKASPIVESMLVARIFGVVWLAAGDVM